MLLIQRVTLRLKELFATMLRVKREKGEGGLPGWAEADPCLKHWSRFPLEPIKRTEYFPK